MEILYCEVGFSHDIGEFSPRNIFSGYFVSCFNTPFLYEIDQKFLPGNPGDLLIMLPGTIVCQGAATEEASFSNDWMCLAGDDFGNLLNKYPLPVGVAFNIGNPYLLRNCIKTLREERLLKRTGYEDIISCTLTETIIEIHRLYHQQQYSMSPVSRIETAREAFMRHPERDWSLQEMARLSDYSASRFSTLYNERYGCSPKADLLNQRIDLAKQLLAYSNLSITEIAERCGFSSIYHFSKYFKEREGFSPSEYVKSARKNLSADDLS